MSTIYGIAVVASTAMLGGCNSIWNGWLDPTILGRFDQNRTMEIRTSLTIEDSPGAIAGAVYPTREDLIPRAAEFQISPGDIVEIEIYELRQRFVPYREQFIVSVTGAVNLPVVGRVQAAGYTAPEFEQIIAEELKARDILRHPEVIVHPRALHMSTYSIFGVGASAASNAPLRAGSAPITKPDLRLLEAINQVGGLNEFVTDIYIFRSDEPEGHPAVPESPAPSEEGPGEFSTPAGETPDDSPGPQEPPAEAEPDVEAEPPSGEREPADEGADAPLDAEGRVDDRSAEDELIDAITRVWDADRNGTATEESIQRAQEPPPDEDTEVEVPADLEAEPVHPWIWVNGQGFVRNPAIQDQRETPRVPLEQISAARTTGPSVDWLHVAGETNYRIIRVPAESLRSGDPEFNIIVRSGDIIRIVSGEVGVYYVMGQVNQPGVYGFGAEPVTLKRAIAGARGLSGLAWPDRCTIYRRVGQREQMIQVNIDRIFAGKDPDFLIRRSDIINVGTHPLAPWLRRLQAWTLPNPLSQIGYSFSYSRNFADVDAYGARQNPNNRPDRFPNLFP